MARNLSTHGFAHVCENIFTTLLYLPLNRRTDDALDPTRWNQLCLWIGIFIYIRSGGVCDKKTRWARLEFYIFLHLLIYKMCVDTRVEMGFFFRWRRDYENGWGKNGSKYYLYFLIYLRCASYSIGILSILLLQVPRTHLPTFQPPPLLLRRV